LRLQERLLRADLPRRTVAMIAAVTTSCVYLSIWQAFLCLGTYLIADLLLMQTFGKLIKKPQSKPLHCLVLVFAFCAMSSYLLLAGLLWLVPGITPKVGAMILIFGGMLSIMLVRSVYLPLTVVNSLPLVGMAGFIGWIEIDRILSVESLFLLTAVCVLGGYFGLTLANYLRIHDELAHARDAALARSKTQGRFLATMSHELRTPLNGILGMSQVLIAKHPGSGAEVIQDSARAMTAMVADLLDNAAIEAGTLRIDLQECDPAKEMQSLVHQWQDRFAEQGLTLGLQLDRNLPDRILADPLRLSQCLSNLLSNALRFTKEGGVTLSLNVHPIGLEAVVTDTGAGVPHGADAQLFQPYGQGYAAQHRHDSGSGLGLSISLGLVRAMGGDLIFERPDNGGARFRLRFPAPLAANADKIPVDPLVTLGLQAKAKLAGRRILVVDDIATNRLVLKLLLRNRGADVIEAESGAETLRILADAAQRAPDAILLDIRMPGLSGNETLVRIRAIGVSCPIIAISADADQEHQRGALALGFDGYLTKPVEDADLLAMLLRFQTEPAIL
jgi:signal transduction histidine kinase/ActR/RegA family two-component response regulator